MISDKKSVQILVNLCEKYGIENVVFSAGSRNAPLIISFNENPFFNCTSIIDERSAAFYALGKAQQLSEPVIICCTSGSAALNYAPAISEAYYQNMAGNLAEKDWHGLTEQFLFLKDLPGFQAFWRDRKFLFSEEFCAYYDKEVIPTKAHTRFEYQ